jgi:prepilin-type N-terminal cleavage/methylation domain-containing protein
MGNKSGSFYNLHSTIYNHKGFTLVEILIVVAILGILAAIVLPEFQNHVQQAKEAAAKDNLRIFREAVERYANDHNGNPPGYLNGNTSSVPNALHLMNQLVKKSTNASGQIANIGTAGYPYGPYLPVFPANPLNGMKSVLVIGNSVEFPTTAVLSYGWVYKPATRELRLYTDGTDSGGKSYFEY